MPKSGQPWIADFLHRSALLEDFRELAQPLLAGSGWPTLDAYTALAERERMLRAPELSPVRFAPPRTRRRRARSKPPIEMSDLYDGSVVLRGEVPCLTESYHDLCNVLAWTAFPRAKRALHQRQFRALESSLVPGASTLPNRRTREQDALTLFDEGGTVLITMEGQRVRLVLFGHGLMEHVSFQPMAVGSAVLVVPAPAPLPRGRVLFEWVDRELSRRLLEPSELAPAAFDLTLSVQASDSPLLGKLSRASVGIERSPP